LPFGSILAIILAVLLSSILAITLAVLLSGILVTLAKYYVLRLGEPRSNDAAIVTQGGDVQVTETDIGYMGGGDHIDAA